MPNINAFRPVVCYINLYKLMSSYGVAICDPRNLKMISKQF